MVTCRRKIRQPNFAPQLWRLFSPWARSPFRLVPASTISHQLTTPRRQPATCQKIVSTNTPNFKIKIFLFQNSSESWLHSHFSEHAENLNSPLCFMRVVSRIPSVDTKSRRTHLDALERATIVGTIHTSDTLGRNGLTGCVDRSDQCKQGPRIDLEQRAEERPCQSSWI